MATTARLPGIYFETVAPPAPALLPRMDIAAFAGFLPSGPIGLPFAVEDSARFKEIFGADLTLAWDAQARQMLLAQTPPAVRAYFRNGGKRCWVLRLANNAMSNEWTIPGLLQVDNLGNIQAGSVQARSEGSWSDDLEVNATLLESPLPAGSLINTGNAPRVKGLNAGDTVQLYYAATQTWAYHTCSDARWFWFQSVQAPEQSGSVGGCGGSPPAAQPDSVTLLGPGASTPLPFLNFCCRTSGAELEMDLLVTRDTALTVPPGSWLRMESGGGVLLVEVESTEAATLAPAAGTAELATLSSTLGWWVLDPATAWAANRGDTAVQVTTVEFELWSTPIGAATLRIADLGLAPDHPRFWQLMPTDSTLYAPQVQPAPLPYAALADDIDHPRFPLAGNGLTVIGLPLGMTALVNSGLSQAASMPGATALDRDGLSSFDESLFLGTHLGLSNSTTLLEDAFALQYDTQTPVQLGGLFALLPVDEVSMLAVPDATLNGWTAASVQTAVLAAPDPLQVSGADGNGNYAVSWSMVATASGYLLQGSSDSSFQTGVTQQDVGPVLSASLQNSPACSEILYYRVSAYGAAGAGPWSATGSVQLGSGEFFACSQLPLAAPVLSRSEEPNRVVLQWTPAPGGFDGFTLQIASDPLFVSGYSLYQGSESGFQYWRVPGPPSYFRVNTQRGGASSPWSNTVATTPTPVSPWTAIPAATAADAAPLMPATHQAMLRIAAARGDLVAILSLPVSYRTEDAALYPAQLAAEMAATESGRVLSYGAIYHPWLVVSDNGAGTALSLRTIPPDGGVCGAIAGTTLKSGAWIAPANIALSNVLDLEPALTSDAEAEFNENQINLIAQQPEGFLILGQDTLVTVEPDLEPLNVRRLLILIRRLALREGVRYVFQNITSTLQRQITGQFDEWMQQMLVRGAFAGLSSDDSYRVIADGSVNTQDSMDQGRFIVELQVAPSVPMQFLTVQLVQSGGQLTLSEV
jgi:hypothetical protein